MFEIAWNIGMGLLGIFAAYVAITAVLLGIYWAFVESPAGPYLIGATILIAFLSAFRSFTGNTRK